VTAAGGGDSEPLSVAVIGAGYWGPNLIRNLQAYPGSTLSWVCDLDEERATRAVGRHSTVRTTTSLETVLDDERVQAVAVATPAGTHAAIATAALEAGKHVLVEKPLASTVDEGAALVELAAARGLTLMCDHTYCYTPAVQRMRDLIVTGSLGDILYVDSVRINLGLVQKDIDVFWDLAPHDLSILDFVLPHRWTPTSVAAHGGDPLGTGKACIGYLTLRLGGDAMAHVHVNWLSPTKIRTMIIGGSRRTLVWDDLNPSQRLSIFDRGVDIAPLRDHERRREILVSYRLGEMIAPALPEQEALGSSVAEFVTSVRTGRPPLTDGRAGLRVLKVLEAAGQSMEKAGCLVDIG
jgi:predicted dehydrogenase